MNLIKKIFGRKKIRYEENDTYEFCPRCEANITLQRGYHNDLPYWVCRGCGEMLINPCVAADDNIAWICDNCKAMLNEQPGFTENCGEWKCTGCGFLNKIDIDEVYLSEAEYTDALKDPYKGMTDEEVLYLLGYREIRCIGDREDIVIVQGEDGNMYVRKTLEIFDESVYRYLMEHPVAGMPRIVSVHRGSRSLVVLEEFIAGRTVKELLDEAVIDEPEAVRIARDICVILKDLHGQAPPIIHRDIKPSNVMIGHDGRVFLLDVNVAKRYTPGEIEDTKLLGTFYYAAPEQFGYGFAASTPKADIYGIGILLNVMITGKIPKEKRASGKVWQVIDKCISLEPDNRYSDDELLAALCGCLESDSSLLYIFFKVLISRREPSLLQKSLQATTSLSFLIPKTVSCVSMPRI